MKFIKLIAVILTIFSIYNLPLLSDCKSINKEINLNIDKNVTLEIKIEIDVKPLIPTEVIVNNTGSSLNNDSKLTELDTLGVNENGTFLFEGDIRVDSDKNALRAESAKWINRRVPYTIANGFDNNALTTIRQAFKVYRQKTCIKFVRKRPSDKDYVNIIPSQGCWSYVGRTGGKQDLSLQTNGCVHRGIVVHELMHAIGFQHEQSRTDRDNYIRIEWGNIDNNLRYNFEKYDQQRINHLGVPYDYGSIMHYGATAFSNKPGQNTITQLRRGATIGQRETLSRIDTIKINRLYKCRKRSGK